MAARNSSVLTIIKAEELPSTTANLDITPEHTERTKARKNSSKKTSSKDLAITESTCKPIDEIASESEIDKTTQKKSKSERSKKKTEVPQGTVKAAEENTSIEVAPQTAKKILPPHPARTPEEAYYIATKYNYQIRSKKIFKSLSPETLDWISERMKTCTGRVSNNLAIDKCPLFIKDELIASFCEDLIKHLVANPSIVMPTWNVLTDNTLTIIAKLHKLYEVGWTAEVIPECRKGINAHFLKIYLLGQLLEHGVQRTT
ncbi:hypothetical protein [Chamaesiphon polymorphus]|nr:hypothetical protein [Chamaesiphon polymorphus]